MVDVVNNVPAGISDSLTGTTANDYTTALNWGCLGFSHKTINLKNTDGANALKYKVFTYAYVGGLPYEEVAETSLVAADTAQIILLYPYAAVKVQVKSSVTNTPATYQVDFDGDD